MTELANALAKLGCDCRYPHTAVELLALADRISDASLRGHGVNLEIVA